MFKRHRDGDEPEFDLDSPPEVSDFNSNKRFKTFQIQIQPENEFGETKSFESQLEQDQLDELRKAVETFEKKNVLNLGNSLDPRLRTRRTDTESDTKMAIRMWSSENLNDKTTNLNWNVWSLYQGVLAKGVSVSTLVKSDYQDLVKIVMPITRLQCSTCGLRLSTQQLMDKHMNWHYLENKQKQKQTGSAKIRGYLPHQDDWCKMLDEDTIHEKHEMELETVPIEVKETDIEKKRKELELKEQKQKELNDIFVPQSHQESPESKQIANGICSICYDKLTISWNDSLEQWVYTGTVLIPNFEAPAFKLPTTFAIKAVLKSLYDQMKSLYDSKSNHLNLLSYQDQLCHVICTGLHGVAPR